MNLNKYKDMRQKAFEIVNRNINMKEGAMFALQTASSASIGYFLADGQPLATIISAGVTLGMAYFLNKELKELPEKRFYHGCRALGLITKRDSKERQIQFKKLKWLTERVGANLYLEETKKMNTYSLGLQTFTGLLAGASSLNFVNEDIKVGTVLILGAGISMGISCLLQKYKNKDIKNMTNYFSQRYKYDDESDDFEFLFRD